MLVDTDVLIWHLRGLALATQRLDALTNMQLSAVTYMELLQGMRSKAELIALQKSLAKRGATQLPITPAITARAIALMESFSLSHGIGIGDALIGATALEHGLSLLTANLKHFGAMDGLSLERFNPNP